MRWRVETVEERKARLMSWSDWFAWFPVRVGNEYAWLETVERQIPSGNDYGFCHYRPKHSLTVKSR